MQLHYQQEPIDGRKGKSLLRYRLNDKMDLIMKNLLRFLGTTLFVLSISLDVAAQNSKSAIAQQLAAPVTSTHEYSTWLLLVAGAVGVVVARKRA